jgi:hypothetical protein
MAGWGDTPPEDLCPEHVLQDGDWRDVVEHMLKNNRYRCVGDKIILIQVGQGARLLDVICHLKRVGSPDALILDVESRVILMEFKYFSELKRLFRDGITHLHAAELGVELQDAKADMPMDELDELYREYMKDAEKFASGYHSS